MANKMFPVGISLSVASAAAREGARVFAITSTRDFPTGLRQGDYGQLGDRSFRYALVPGVGDTTHRLWTPPEIYDDSLRVEAFATGAESPLALAAQGLMMSLTGTAELTSKGDFLELHAPRTLAANSIAQLLSEYTLPAYLQAEYIAVAGEGCAWGLTLSSADYDLPTITSPYPYYFISQSGEGYTAKSDISNPKQANTLSVFSEVGLFGATAFSCSKSFAKLKLRNLYIVSAS